MFGFSSPSLANEIASVKTIKSEIESLERKRNNLEDKYDDLFRAQKLEMSKLLIEIESLKNK